MKKLFFILTIFSTFLLIGCNKNLENEESTQTSAGVNNNIPKKTFIYPYTGEISSDNPNLQTAYMSIIENSSFARPQNGLSEADIVYETSAEGGIPRFLALFHKNSPEKIGPVRSVRPYFLTFAKEHALPFGHCGGSSAAISEIKSDSSLMSLNEMFNSKAYFRDTNRKAPHNLYTSSDKLKNLIKEKNFNISTKQFFKYDDNALNTSKEIANNIHIEPNKIYTIDYKFENGKYTKYMDNEVSIDANNNNPVAFTNVIVQKTDIYLNEDGSHLDIDLVGEGTGYLFTNGKKSDITWNKISEYSQTKFYDSKGNEIKLSPGNTIINVIDKEAKISIE